LSVALKTEGNGIDTGRAGRVIVEIFRKTGETGKFGVGGVALTAIRYLGAAAETFLRIGTEMVSALADETGRRA